MPDRFSEIEARFKRDKFAQIESRLAKTEYAKRNPGAEAPWPEELAQFDQPGRAAKYLEGLKVQDAETAKALAPTPLPEATTGEKFAAGGRAVIDSAFRRGEQGLAFLQSLPALAGGNFSGEFDRRLAEVDAKGSASTALRESALKVAGAPRAAAALMDAPEERGRQALEATPGGRAALATAHAAGDLAVLGPAAGAFGAVPTFAVAGAADAPQGERTRGAMTGGIMALLGPAAGQYAAEGLALARVIPARLRTAIAHGMGWAGVQGAVGEIDGHPMTQEEAVHAFGIGFLQTFTQAHPKATRLDLERAFQAKVDEMVRQGSQALPRGVMGEEPTLTPAPRTSLPGAVPERLPALPEQAGIRGRERASMMAPEGPAIPMPSGLEPRPGETGGGVEGPGIPLGPGRAPRSEMVPREGLERISDPLLPVRETIQESRAQREADTLKYREGIGDIPAAPEAIVKSVPRRLSEEAGVLRLPSGAELKAAAQRGEQALYDLLQVPKNIARRYGGPAGQLTSDRGSVAGDKIGRAEVLADVRTRKYQADITPAANSFLGAAQGGGIDFVTKGGRAKTAANQTAQEPGDSGFKSRLREWIEADAPTSSSAEQLIKQRLRTLLAWTWRAQSQRGFTTNIGTKEVPMTEANRPKNVLPYARNELGREINEAGSSHNNWTEWVDAHAAVNPKMSREAVEKYLLKESANEKTGRVFGAEGHMASEFSRTINWPDFIKVNGKFTPVQVVNPFTYGQHLIGPGARVVGAQEVLGRGSKSIVPRLMKEHADAVPKGGAKDAETALRAIFGMEPSPAFKNEVMNPSALSLPGMFSKGYDALGSLYRVAVRTGAAGYQTPDLLAGNQAVLFGVRNNAAGLIRTLANFGKRAAGLGETQAMKDLVASGAKTEGIHDRSRDVHKNAIGQAIRRFTRLLGSATSRPFDDAQASTSGFGAKSFTKNLLEKAGTFGKFERERVIIRLKAFADIPRAAAERLLDGESTQVERDFLIRQIETRGSARATGSDLAPSQRSTLSASPLAKKALTFYRWFENNMATSARFMRSAGESWGQKGLTGKAAAATEVTRFMALKAINGAAAQMLASALFPRDEDDGMGAEWQKLMDDPAGYLVSAAAFNMAGGTISNFVTQGRIDIKRTLPGRLYRAVTDPDIKRDVPITRAVR